METVKYIRCVVGWFIWFFLEQSNTNCTQKTLSFIFSFFFLFANIIYYEIFFTRHLLTNGSISAGYRHIARRTTERSIWFIYQIATESSCKWSASWKRHLRFSTKTKRTFSHTSGSHKFNRQNIKENNIKMR